MNKTLILILAVSLFYGCAKKEVIDKDFNAIFSKQSNWQSLNQQHIIKELEHE